MAQAPNTAPRVVSLVIPVFNEEETISYLRSSINDWRATVPWNVEVVLVDDGSRDRSLELLRDWATSECGIKVLNFSRNFGHQAAVTAGLHAASGDAVVIIDADLQDPLEVIIEMVRAYEQGYDVVYGQRISREAETWFKRATAWMFYRIMRTFVHSELPADTGDFRLVSRRCLDVILRMNEVHRFLRGMFAWVGFHQRAITYDRKGRKHGTTKYPLRKMIFFAWNAAVSFSTFPIQLITVAGISTAAAGFGYGAYSLLRAALYHDTVTGWATIIALNAVIGGAMLMSLGVIGAYVGRIYEQVKNRPLYVVQEAFGNPLESRAEPCVTSKDLSACSLDNTNSTNPETSVLIAHSS